MRTRLCGRPMKAISKTAATVLPGERVPWVDYAKGIGIIVVVFAHVVRWLNLASIFPNPDAAGGVYNWLASFPMAIFSLSRGSLPLAASHVLSWASWRASFVR